MLVKPLVPLFLILALSACASGASSPRGGPGPDGNRAGFGRPQPGGAGGFESAMRQVNAGDYEAALPGLRCIATLGPGYEIAQYFAGYSALRLADAPDTPEMMAAELRVDGFDRLIEAANAGWGAAQAELATQFSGTGHDAGLREAAYWAAVYRHNRRELTLGLDRLDDNVEQRIVAALSPADLSSAEDRAAGFALTPLPARDTPPGCESHMRRGGAGFGPGGRDRDGRGGPPGGDGRGGGPGNGSGRPGG